MGRSRGLRSFSSYSLRNVKHLNHCNVARIKVVDSENKKSVKIRADPDLNQGPADLQSAALTTELCTHATTVQLILDKVTNRLQNN